MSPRSPITTHVLDTARGQPAEHVALTLERREGEGWQPLSEGETDADGRCTDLLQPGSLLPGVYRLRFDTEGYWKQTGFEGFYPYVEVVFTIVEVGQHYHVPLLLSPYGYSTYRGS